ncbi:MAG: hypothetical protein Q8926_06030, partial [Bacteroidota bacterium]|nr:hypothetical protein [Bacteroidota bacterium]
RDAPEKNSGNRTAGKPVTGGRVKGMRYFTAYSQVASGLRKMTGARRSLLLQKITESRPAVRYFSFPGSDPLPQTRRNVSFSEPTLPEEPKRRTKTTHGLIYLGRLPECKKLKIWIRPVDSSLSGSII